MTFSRSISCLVPVCLFLSGSSLAVPAEPPAGNPPDLAGLHIALDVGHNKVAGGATSARGRSEYLFNLDTAQAIAEVLRAAGAKVSIINEKGGIYGLAERPRIADQLGAHAFISIHHDAVNDKYLQKWEVEGKTWSYSDQFRGYSVFCSKKHVKAVASRELALAVGAAMLQAGFKPTLHHNERIPGENKPLINDATGVYEFTDLVVGKAGKLPSVLLECGVIVHREEELEVQKPEYQRRIGQALAAALHRAYEKKLIGPAANRPAFRKLLAPG